MLWAHKNDRDTAGAAPGADAAGDAVPEGREQYWVWRKGKHDDLVLAVALACWGARRVFPRTARDVGLWVRGWQARRGFGRGTGASDGC